MIYDLGDSVPLEHDVYVDGVLTDATVALTVTAPDSITSTPSISNPSTGVYQANVPTDQTGVWIYVWSISGAVVDVAPGQFTVADPAPPIYFPLSELKTARKITNTTFDDALLRSLQSASRAIDKRTGRQPGGFALSADTSQRIFSPRGRTVRTREGDLFLIDEIGVDTGLIVELGSGSSWTAVTDYETRPDNALARLTPITSLLRTLGTWVYGSTRLRVTARWGWPEIPDEIAEATKLLANRYYMRKDSPEGVAGSAEWGMLRLSRWDPDVEALIAPYMLPGLA